jgi:hypothetical protein
MQQSEPSYTTTGIDTVERSGKFHKRLNKELPYDPEILLLGTHQRETTKYVHTKLVHKCSQQSYSQKVETIQMPIN